MLTVREYHQAQNPMPVAPAAPTDVRSLHRDASCSTAGQRADAPPTSRDPKIARQFQRTLCRSRIPSLHDEAEKGESVLALRAELVNAWARISDRSHELNVWVTHRRTGWPAEVRRVEGGEVGLAEVAQDGPRAERLDLVVRVSALGEVPEFAREVAARVAGRDLARFKRGVADGTVRLRHAMIGVAA